MEQTLKKNKNYTIDLLRALSILYIVGYWHLFNYTSAFPGYKNVYTTWLTVVILALFTFLSGYLIGAKEEFNNIHDLFSYYTKKVLRIYPLYLLAIILFYLLDISDFRTLLKASVFISMFKTPAPLTLWFITMIFNFYIIAPLLLIAKNKIHIFISITLAVLAALAAYAYFTNNLDYRIFVYFPPFALGIITSIRKEALDRINPFWYLILFAASLPLIFLNIESVIISRTMRIPLVLTGSLSIYFLAIRLKKQPFENTITNISYASFCMFLFHRPLYSFLKTLYFPDSGYLQVAYLVLVCLPLVIIISWLIQKIYDTINGYFFNKNKSF